MSWICHDYSHPSMYLLKAIRVSQVEIPVGISLIPLLVYMDLASDFLKPTEDDLKEFAVKRS